MKGNKHGGRKTRIKDWAKSKHRSAQEPKNRTTSRAGKRKIASGTSRQPPPFKPSGGKGIDPGIANEVRILFENGVETTESCQGGQGHPFPEPTVRFAGGKSEGLRALGIALQHGLRVTALRRVWTIIDGEAVGPFWEMTFDHPEGGGVKAIAKKDGTMSWEWR